MTPKKKGENSLMRNNFKLQLAYVTDVYVYLPLLGWIILSSQAIISIGVKELENEVTKTRWTCRVSDVHAGLDVPGDK